MTDMKNAAKNSLQRQQPAKLATLAAVKSLLSNDSVKRRFEEVLGQKAAQFTASITSLVSSKTNFKDVDPNSVIASAMIAATLDLPINPNLGFAYIIPYAKVASFQMGYKGYIQLALRSGQYKSINATEIYEGELVSRNRLTGEIVLNEDAKISEKVIGYASHFKLINGFEKTMYMTVEEVTAHGKKYSKSFNSKDGRWQIDFDGMAKKTVLKLLLSKFGLLSIDMQKAVEADQGAITEDEEGNIQIDYVDNPETVETDFEEISNGELNWESPTAVIEAIEAIKDIDTYNKFKAENKQRLEAFGGPDGDLIQTVMVSKEAALGGGK